MALKRVVLAVLALALIGAAALLVLAARFDPEALGQAVLRKLNATGATEVEARRFSLNPLTGLRIDDATARGELSAGRFTASLESLRLEHEPWSLLRGELVVRELVLRAPVVTLVSTPRAPASVGGRPEAQRTLPSPAGEPGPTRRIRFAISRIEASGCQLFSRAEGGMPPASA